MRVLTGRIAAALRPEFPLGLLVWAAVVGLVGAMATVAFREGIQLAERLFTGRAGGLVAAAESLPVWLRFLIPALGGLAAGAVLQLGMQFVARRSTTDYMEAVAVGDGVIGVRASLVKSLSSLLTIGSGGSIGREGAMVQLAAMTGSLSGRMVGATAPTLRMLVACGAAAGIASAYNAPIAAAIFVAEIVLGSIAIESVGPLIVAAVVANATVHELFGYAPVYRIPPLAIGSAFELPLFLAVGVVAGHLAPTLLWLLDRASAIFSALALPVYARIGLGGLVVGAISAIEPAVWGNGYSVVNSILNTPWTWTALASVLVLKIAATAATAGSGAVGGVFTPTLFAGAALGALLGTAAHAVAPGLGSSPAVFAVVGMGAFLAGTTFAPITSILMVFEMTAEYALVLPLMLGCIASHYVARYYRGGASIYSAVLRQKRAEHGRVTRSATIASLAHPVQSPVAPDEPVARLARRFSDAPGGELFVVDREDRLLGVISRDLFERAPPKANAIDLARTDVPVLAASATLGQAADAFLATDLDVLPVVSDERTRVMVGTISRRDVRSAVGDALI